MRALWLVVMLASLALPALGETAVRWPRKRLSVGMTLSGIQLEGEKNATLTIEGLQKDGHAVALSLDKAGKATLNAVRIASDTLTIKSGAEVWRTAVPTLAGYWSLLPALLAIGLAFWSRQVLLSLFGGAFLGVWLMVRSPLRAFTETLNLLVETVADSSHASVILFTLAMGGMIGVVSAAGGTKGMVVWFERFAKTPRSGALATWLMGLAVFFDDYASALIVGGTMRPITDGLKISREKLAYIVDSTAAPIASLMFSTWVAYEISLIGEAMGATTGQATEVFIAGLSARFYPIYALAFVGILAWMQRDFGPMLRAERRARHEGKLVRDGGAPMMDTSLIESQEHLDKQTPRGLNGLVPIVSLIAVFLGTILVRGADASYDAMLYASFVSLLVASALAMLTRSLTLGETLEAMMSGIRAMLLAIMVLVLAWSIGQVMKDLDAGGYVASLVGSTLPAWSLATLTFVVAGFLALATGTSFGTMAVLFPIVLPVAQRYDDPAQVVATASAVLAGAVFGDHCSPISDTTVLSSVACASDHVDHTRTQAPYALLCAFTAVVFGTLPLGFGVPSYILLPLGLAFLAAVLWFVGKKI